MSRADIVTVDGPPAASQISFFGRFLVCISKFRTINSDMLLVTVSDLAARPLKPFPQLLIRTAAAVLAWLQPQFASRAGLGILHAELSAIFDRNGTLSELVTNQMNMWNKYPSSSLIEITILPTANVKNPLKAKAE